MLEREIRVKIKKAARDLAASIPTFSESEWAAILVRALKDGKP